MTANYPPAAIKRLEPMGDLKRHKRLDTINEILYDER